MEAVLTALEASPPAQALRESPLAYPLVNAAHILGLALLVGAIATLDLRLLGAFRTVPAALLAAPLAQVAAAGLCLAVATGALLFSTRPSAYLANPAFVLKLGFVALGTLNALLLRQTRGWRLMMDGGAATPGVRIGALASLALWLGALLSGRWIGFLG